VLGDLILDVSARLARPLAPGSDAAATIRFHQGGSAANTARQLARLGVATTFIGAVGRDAWATALVRALRADGVRVHVVRRPGGTARLVAVVTADGERSFLTDRGAADALEAAAVRPSWLRAAAVLHLPAYALLARPLVDAAARAAGLVHAAGGRVSVDLASAAPLREAGPRAVAERLAGLAPDLLLGNLAEVAAMTGATDGAALLELAPLVVVKAGPAGCRVLTRATGSAPGLDLLVRARPREATDTTGAGHRAAHALLGRPRPELRL